MSVCKNGFNPCQKSELWRQVPVALALLMSVLTQPLWAAMPTEIALPGERAFPESITASSDGTIYIGSVGAGGVTRVLPHGQVAETWIGPGTYGTASVFGVLADEKSNTLWVCSNDLSARGVMIPGGDPGSVLKGFDLKSGAGKVSVPFPAGPAICNDMTVGPDGALYVTNTLSPQILRLPRHTNQFEVWFTDPQLQPTQGSGLDGIAFGADGNLYVDRYTPGDLYRINVVNGKATGFTPLHPSHTLALTDALRRVGPMQFLLVEGAGRVDFVTVHGDAVAVRTLKEGLRVPTGVAPLAHSAWISEGQLDVLLHPTHERQKPFLPFKIYSVSFP